MQNLNGLVRVNCSHCCVMLPGRGIFIASEIFKHFTLKNQASSSLQPFSCLFEKINKKKLKKKSKNHVTVFHMNGVNNDDFCI